ncbi:hypothetical protein [Shinella sp. BYT-45]|uniref:hypothetical protein n=1 Tax=Shinella sp. BYT-45 TaxID=3377377 RepID=UPI00397FCD5A
MKVQSDQSNRMAIYGIPVAMAAIFAIILHFMGNPGNLIFVKLAIIPPYLLAGRATSLLFPLSQGGRLDGRFWERQFLDALLLACFLTVMLWQPDRSLGEIATGAFSFIPLYVGLMALASLGFARIGKQRGS